MKTVGLHSGEIHASRQRAGTQFVAVHGAVRLTYRDPSLDWLMDLWPRVCVGLEEGDAHVISCNAWVEVDPVEDTAVVGLLEKPDGIGISLEKFRAWLKEKTRSSCAKA
jgi:hypothetical protein